MAPIEYITELSQHDVLSGRGGATNSYRGNRAFRTLVKEYQPQYLQAKKRDKPAVATIVVDLVRQQGGRFLRRCSFAEQRLDAASMGPVVWVDIGDDRAREKTCQALREGAPEIRKKTLRSRRRRRRNQKNGTIAKRPSDSGSATSSSSSSSLLEDEDAGEGSPRKGVARGSVAAQNSWTDEEIIGERGKASADMSPSTHNSTQGTRQVYSQGSKGVTWERQGEHGQPNDSDNEENLPLRNQSTKTTQGYAGPYCNQNEPILIRPWSRLIPDQIVVAAIGLDQLSAVDRAMYMQDFLPPCPREEAKERPDRPRHNTSLGSMGAAEPSLVASANIDLASDGHMATSKDKRDKVAEVAGAPLWPVMVT
jgi:Neuregulin intracellular region